MSAGGKIKTLPNRRKKASKGKLIRISDDVFNLLQKKRQGKSWDSLMRRMLGLPDRAGITQPLVVGWLDQDTGQLYLDEAEARGAAVVAAAKRGTKKIKQPIKMREEA